MQITDKQVVQLASVAALMGRFAGCLADFEVETIAEIGRRYLGGRQDTVVTAREWSVVELALEDMERAQARALAGTRAA